MGATDLKAAVDRGEPLVEVTVKFRAGVEAVAAVDLINATFEDFDIHPKPWYDQPQLRVAWATKSTLGRLFGWLLQRVPLGRYDEETRTWGHWPDAYRWEEVTGPDLSRSEVGTLIESIGLSQPGAGDNGQWWE